MVGGLSYYTLSIFLLLGYVMLRTSWLFSFSNILCVRGQILYKTSPQAVRPDSYPSACGVLYNDLSMYARITGTPLLLTTAEWLVALSPTCGMLPAG